MTRTTLVTVTLDGEPIRLLVDRLSVVELDEVSRCVVARGSSGTPEASLLATYQQSQCLDRFVRVFERDFLMNDQPVAAVGTSLGGQTESISQVFNALLDAQALSTTEQHDLTVSIRFLAWLGSTQSEASKWRETGTNCQACHALGLCGKRACGNAPSKKPVWHDQSIHVRVCPVKSLTPDVERVLRLFGWTHTYGAHGFQQACLPSSAHMSEQEAWTLSALAHARAVYRDVHRQQVTHG